VKNEFDLFIYKGNKGLKVLGCAWAKQFYQFVTLVMF